MTLQMLNLTIYPVQFLKVLNKLKIMLFTNSVSTENGANISGDPGATQQYAFSIQFANVGANPTITAKSVQLIVTDDGGHTATCTITQAAGDPVLSVSPESVTLDWNAYTEGTSASFALPSSATRQAFPMIGSISRRNCPKRRRQSPDAG